MKSRRGWSPILDGKRKNFNGNNKSGFSGLPGGQRLYNGNFADIDWDGFWWSSWELNINSAWFRVLNYTISFYKQAMRKESGLSVRCIKD